ncbi:hypothetical protein PV08_04801 [Exophiala spinifera]|uniref:Cytochrome c oxidase-assembly factor COX23, mitochondrial n=1 Tax=Exophiala spinifera TaxID=91928 RepID=A0A0D1YQW5_9EURO|nr:uncharacterized protein PV08_04801 [Exophiala spinifera]KIW17606.1 hypothetical protein PV08_04801 [Exophiala spinifera]
MATTAESDQSAGQEVNWKKEDKAFQAKRTSEYYDPCQEAANKSIRCMNRNGGDRDMCQDYFQYVDRPTQPTNTCPLNEALISLLLARPEELTVSTENRAYRDCKKEWMARRKAQSKSWFS